jgi:hypothetical protein
MSRYISDNERYLVLIDHDDDVQEVLFVALDGGRPTGALYRPASVDEDAS